MMAGDAEMIDSLYFEQYEAYPDEEEENESRLEIIRDIADYLLNPIINNDGNNGGNDDDGDNEGLLNQKRLLLKHNFAKVVKLRETRFVKIRKAITAFVTRAFLVDNSIAPEALEGLMAMMRDENDVSIQKDIVLTSINVFRRCVSGIFAGLSGYDNQLWTKLWKFHSTLTRYLDSPSESLRSHTIKFIEMFICIFSRDDGVKSDHRHPDNIPPPLTNEKEIKLRSLGTNQNLAIPVNDYVMKLTRLCQVGSCNESQQATLALSTLASHRPKFIEMFINTWFGIITSSVAVNQSLSESQKKRVFFTITRTLKLTSNLSHIRPDQKDKILLTLQQSLQASHARTGGGLKSGGVASSGTTGASGGGLSSATVAGGGGEDYETEENNQTKRMKMSSNDDDNNNNNNNANINNNNNNNNLVGMGVGAGGIVPVPVGSETGDEGGERQKIIDSLMETLPKELVKFVLQDQNNMNKILEAYDQMTTEEQKELLGGGQQQQQQQQVQQVPEVRDPRLRRQKNQQVQQQQQAQPTQAQPQATSIINAQNKMVFDKYHDILSKIFKQVDAERVQLSEDESNEIVVGCFERVIEVDRRSIPEDIQRVKCAVLSRILVANPINSEYFQRIMKRIESDEGFIESYPILISWLYLEYAVLKAGGVNKNNNNNKNNSNNNNNEEDSGNRLERYSLIFRRMLEVAPTEEYLDKLFNDAPFLTPASLDMLEKYCQDAATAGFALIIWKNLILFRPMLYKECLPRVLKFVLSENDKIRDNAQTMVFNHLYPFSNQLKNDIKSFGREKLQEVCGKKILVQQIEREKDKEKEKENVVAVVESMKLRDARSRISFFFKLCLCDNDMMREVISIFPKLIDEGKILCQEESVVVIRSIGRDNEKLFKILSESPASASDYLIFILHTIARDFGYSLTVKDPPSKAIFFIRTKELYETRFKDDVRFIVPALLSLTPSEQTEIVPKLLSMADKEAVAVFEKLIIDSRSQKISHGDLFLLIQNSISIQDSDKRLLSAKKVILHFLDSKAVSDTTIQHSMQKMVDQHKLPTLFFWTILHLIGARKHLTTFIVSHLLSRANGKNIFAEDANMRTGFKLCLQKTRPTSYPLFCQIPSNQWEFLFDDSEVKEDFKRWLNQGANGRYANVALRQFLSRN